MAWTDTCKIEAVNQVERFKEQGLGVREAIRRLAEESGIPYNTLSNWVWPRNTEPAVKTNSEVILQETGEPDYNNDPPARKEEQPKTLPSKPPKIEINLNVTEAWQFAEMAVSQLERIRFDDPERVNALTKVSIWIDEQIIRKG